MPARHRIVLRDSAVNISGKIPRGPAKNAALRLPIEESRGGRANREVARKAYVPQEAGVSTGHDDINRVLATYQRA